VVGIRLPGAPPKQRHHTIPTGRDSTYLKRNSVSTKPATSDFIASSWAIPLKET